MGPHVFTLDEAKQMIPQLEEVTSLLLHKRQQIQQKHDQLLMMDLISGEHIHDETTPDGQEYIQKSNELEEIVASFEQDLIQLSQQSCFLRDLDEGYVDLFSVRGQTLVYLSWKKGEKEIHHWHELDADYRDRKLL